MDARLDAQDDREPAIEIPILDGPDDFGVWACCGGKRWHTDDCDQGPTPNQVLGELANRRIRAQHDAAADALADRIEAAS